MIGLPPQTRVKGVGWQQQQFPPNCKQSYRIIMKTKLLNHVSNTNCMFRILFQLLMLPDNGPVKVGFWIALSIILSDLTESLMLIAQYDIRVKWGLINTSNDPSTYNKDRADEFIL